MYVITAIGFLNINLRDLIDSLYTCIQCGVNDTRFDNNAAYMSKSFRFVLTFRSPAPSSVGHRRHNKISCKAKKIRQKCAEYLSDSQDDCRVQTGRVILKIVVYVAAARDASLKTILLCKAVRVQSYTRI